MSNPSPATESYSRLHKALALGVHVYTASGIIFALLAAMSIVKKDWGMAFFWMCIAVLIDSSDGFLARKVQVKKVMPSVDGSLLDNIVDYITYTFLPLWMVVEAGWLPGPAWLWVSFPLVLSLFGFAHSEAKQDDGFFLGFPSYWNFYAFYTHVCFAPVSPYFALFILLFFSVLNVVPLRFVYPSKAKRWQGFFVIGALVWTVVFFYMLFAYYIGKVSGSQPPAVPVALAWASLSYPALYLLLSVYLDFSDRKKKAAASASSSA